MKVVYLKKQLKVNAINPFTGTTSGGVQSSTFNLYTGTTAPNQFANRIIFNGYTGTTNTAINNRLLTSSFNTYSANTQTAINNTIQTANNGLTRSGSNVRLGGTLTGNTTVNKAGFNLTLSGTGNSTTIRDRNVIIIGQTSAGTTRTFLQLSDTLARFQDSRTGTTATGIQYNANYSANFTARSLTDVGYVTGLTSQRLLTANNGLTKSGSNVRLGGSLTGTTLITSSNFPLRFDFDDGFTRQYLDYSPAGFNLEFTDSGLPNSKYSQLFQDSSGTIIRGYFGGSTILTQFLISGIDARFTDSRTTTRGIQYNGNYSSGFNNRSLPDVQFVTGRTSQIVGRNVSTLVSSPSGSNEGWSIIWDNTNNRYTLANVSGGGGGVSVALFNSYTGTTAPNQFANRTIFNGYTASTQTDINNRVLTSAFNTYSASTQTAINNRLLTSAFNTYSANTQTAINNRVLTANNGLTKSGSNVRLGGTLTGNTTINTNNNRLTISGTTGDLVLSSISGNTIIRSQQTNGTVNAELLLSRNAIRITDSRTGTTANGLTYNANYSANYIARSLVDAGFVTGITSNRVSSNRSRDLNIYSDFLGNVGDFVSTVSGTGAAIAFTAVDPGGRSGTATLNAGTTATGRAHLSSNASAIRLGAGNFFFESSVRIPTLSTTGETFIVNVGLNDNLAGEAVDGVYFRYTNATNTGRWQLISRSNSVETAINSTVTVTANQWYELQFIVNPAGTLISAFIDGTSIGTINTNIPIAAGRETGIGTGIRKTVGVTSRTIDVDYIDLTYNYTVDR